MRRDETLLVAGGLVADVECERTTRADIWIENDTITAVGPASSYTQATDGTTVIDASDCLIVPGLINAHTHSYATLARQLGSGLPLEPWMMYSWAVTGGRSPQDIHLSALLQGVEAMRSGTTMLLDHLGGDVELISHAADAYQRLGMRATLAPMISDIPLHKTVGLQPRELQSLSDDARHLLEPPSASALLDATKSLHANRHDSEGLIQVFVGPSAPQRCSPELLDGCASLRDELHTGVHTHLLESRVQASDPRAHLERLEKHDLVDDRLVAAHGVWVDEEELQLLGGRGASLVHNPQSNLQLGSGIAALPRWRINNINASLGTDGANCGGSLNMLASMHLATLLHRPGVANNACWESPWSTLRMATQGGARALGLDHIVGKIATGYKADLALFQMEETPYAACPDALEALILSGLPAHALHVICDGKVVVKDNRPTAVDAPDLIARAGEAAEALIGQKANAIQTVADTTRAELEELSRQSPSPRSVIAFE